MFKQNKIGMDNESNRLEWVKQTVRKIPNGLRILDAGAGELKYKQYCPHLDYISQDFCQYNGTGDNKGLHKGEWDTSKIDIISDITSIPEPDNSFDAIMCLEVFEHLPEPVKAIEEFSRLLRPKGYLILTAPFCSLTHFSPYHYYSGFNRYFYEQQLDKYGFHILEITPNGNWFSYIAQEVRRLPSCAEKYASIHQFTIFERLVIKLMLSILARIEARQSLSSELLCYGYHVLAQKKQ